MKKLLLTTALALLWSFSANAQAFDRPKMEAKSGCTASLTHEEALAKTADGNVNTFSAIYSTVTNRDCGLEAIKKDNDKDLGSQINPRVGALPCCRAGVTTNCRHDGCAR